MNNLQVTFSNKPEFMCLCRVKWFQVLLFNTSNLIEHYLFEHSYLVPGIAM